MNPPTGLTSYSELSLKIMRLSITFPPQLLVKSVIPVNPVYFGLWQFSDYVTPFWYEDFLDRKGDPKEKGEFTVSQRVLHRMHS